MTIPETTVHASVARQHHRKRPPPRGDGARCVFALADPTAEPGGAKKGDRLVAKNPHLKVTAPAKRGHAKLPGYFGVRLRTFAFG